MKVSTIFIPNNNSKTPEEKVDNNLIIHDEKPSVKQGEKKLWLQLNVDGDPDKITLNLVVGE